MDMYLKSMIALGSTLVTILVIHLAALLWRER
mgnify:CR=1 FL=1